MTALEDSMESIKECASRWKQYATVTPNEAEDIKQKADELKKQKNRRLTEIRRKAEEKLIARGQEWEL